MLTTQHILSSDNLQAPAATREVDLAEERRTDLEAVPRTDLEEVLRIGLEAVLRTGPAEAPHIGRGEDRHSQGEGREAVLRAPSSTDLDSVPDRCTRPRLDSSGCARSHTAAEEGLVSWTGSQNSGRRLCQIERPRLSCEPGTRASRPPCRGLTARAYRRGCGSGRVRHPSQVLGR
jgi:hypothetical protein